MYRLRKVGGPVGRRNGNAAAFLGERMYGVWSTEQRLCKWLCGMLLVSGFTTGWVDVADAGGLLPTGGMYVGWLRRVFTCDESFLVLEPCGTLCLCACRFISWAVRIVIVWRESGETGLTVGDMVHGTGSRLCTGILVLKGSRSLANCLSLLGGGSEIMDGYKAHEFVMLVMFSVRIMVLKVANHAIRYANTASPCYQE